MPRGRLLEVKSFDNTNGDLLPTVDPRWSTAKNTPSVIDIQSGVLRQACTASPSGGYTDYTKAKWFNPYYNFEMRVDCQILGTAEQYQNLGFRCSQSDSSVQLGAPTDGYFLEWDSTIGAGTSSFAIRKNIATTTTNVQVSTNGNTNNNWYTICIICDGPWIRAKAWLRDSGNGEPLTWFVDVVDRNFFSVVPGNQYITLGNMGGSVGLHQLNYDNFMLWEWRATPINLEPPFSGGGGGGTAYTDDVQTDITAVTSETDSRGMFEDQRTDVASITSETDVAALNDNVTTTGTGATTADNTAAMTDGLDSVISSTTFETDGMAFSDQVTSTAIGTTSETDALAMTEAANTTVTGVTTLVDSAGYSESVFTNVAGFTSESDVAALNDNVQTDGSVFTGSTEQLSMFENVTTTVNGVTTSTEQLAMFESTQTDAVGVTSETDRADYNDSPQTTINGVTSGTDNQSGQPTENSIVYRAGPLIILKS